MRQTRVMNERKTRISLNLCSSTSSSVITETNKQKIELSGKYVDATVETENITWFHLSSEKSENINS